MKNTKLVYGITGLVLGIFLGVIVIANFQGTNGLVGMGTRNNERSDNRMMSGQASIDAHFIEQMIPHHEDAITMAEIARKNAQKQEIKDLAEDIIIAQTKEIDDMKKWYKNWYDRELPTGDDVMNQHGMMGNGGMHMGKMGNESDISKLEEAEDFDRMFIEEMISHHQMAVMMASMLKNGSSRPEMLKLADDIITAQTSEIDQMRDWYTLWYQ